MRALVALVACSLMLASACGGGSASTVTVTQAGSTMSSTTASSATEADQIRAYLAAMTPIRAVLHGDGAKLEAALQPVNKGVWPAKASIESIATDFDNSAVKLEGVTPPPNLKAAHQEYIDAVTAEGTLIHEMASDVGSKDKLSLYQDVEQLKTSGAAIKLTKWKVQVEAAAQAAGVPVPAWVKGTGG